MIPLTEGSLQALEALRKLRTEKVQEAKELKLKLETTRTHKDNADSLRAEKQAGEAKAQRLVSQISGMNDQLQTHDVVQHAGALHDTLLHLYLPPLPSLSSI